MTAVNLPSSSSIDIWNRLGLLARKLEEAGRMPAISMFYGITIYMYFFDTRMHNRPHIHARYQEEEGVFDVVSGELLDGSLRHQKTRLVQAWIEIHKDELLADWQLAVKGERPFKIEPLR